MNENEFEKYITSVIKEYGANYIDDALIDNTPHKFSPEFEHKMNVLMGKSYKNIKITPKRLLIILTAALLAIFTMAMSVSAVREAFKNFFANIFDTHTVVQSVDDRDTPLDFADKYEITADMPDYELIEFNEFVSERTYIYENENCTVFFAQYIKDSYDLDINTEGYYMEKIFVNECEGFYVDMSSQNGKLLSWDNGDYILSILVSSKNDYRFSKSELIKMADSVQKVE